MTQSFNRHSLAVVAASIVAAATFSACGGGGSNPPFTSPSPVTGPSSNPTSSPTSSPTTAPPGTPQASTTSIAFQSGTAQTFNISEPGYSGAFTESDTCNPLTGQIASVTALSNTQGAASYQVGPIAAGTCTVTITDASRRSVSISVSVATAAINVQ